MHDADLLDRRYHLGVTLGEGGMGRVFLAHHLALGVEVAIKLSLRGGADEHQRMRAEALALRKARHAGVVPFLDFGVADDGRPFLVMERVPGRSLSGLLREHGPLPRREALEIIEGLAAALDHVHAVGLVHRDVKPANVVVDQGRVTLVDFGLAIDARDVPDDEGTWLEGTPEHMAPEQVAGGVVGPAADRWALAGLALELLTGERPYASQATAGATLLSILDSAPRSARELGLGGRDIERFFVQALSRDPADRPPSCVALAEALREALRTAFRTDPRRRVTTSVDLPTVCARSASLRPAA